MTRNTLLPRRLLWHFALALCALPALAVGTYGQGAAVVYDPLNHIQALARYATLVQQYRQMITQYEHWVRQARRLPGDLHGRYAIDGIAWRIHEPVSVYGTATGYLQALDYGDTMGQGYNRAVRPLLHYGPAFAQIPTRYRQHAALDYGTVEIADEAARLAMHQVGAIRYNGRRVKAVIDQLESDTVSANDEYHTQAALLNKINTAGVVNLRTQQSNTQLLAHTLEQILVDAKRKRDVEADHINADIYLRTYGPDFNRRVNERTADILTSFRILR